MEIYAIRHGESEANLTGAFSGWAQISLTEKGVEQARNTGLHLRNIEFDQIISSDLLRARQTTEAVFPGKAYSLDQRLREINVGVCLEMRQRPECFAQYGDKLKVALENRNFLAFDGESLEDHKRRVTQCLDELTATQPDNARIALVAHAGTLFCMLCYMLHADLDIARVFSDNASVARFVRQDGVWRLISWGQTF